MTQSKADAVISHLSALYERDISLYGSSIQRHDPWLWQRIYSKEQAGGRPFESLYAARQALAAKFRSENRFADAEKVLSFEVQKSHNKLSEGDIEKRKSSLVAKFLVKARDEEDLNYRAQLKHDKIFVNRVRRFFKGYDNIYQAAGLNKEDYSLSIKFPIEYYFSLVHTLVEMKQPLDATTISEVLPRAHSSFVDHFKSYYAGLSVVRDMLLADGRTADAEYANPATWKQYREDTNKTINEQKRSRKLRRVNYLDSNSYMDVKLKDIDLSSCKDLSQVVKTLRESENYLSTTDIAQQVAVTPENIRRSFPLRYGGRTVHIKFNNKEFYFFHKSVVDDFEGINNNRPANTSMRLLANELNTSYSRIRAIKDTYSLGTLGQSGGHVPNFQFSDGERSFISHIVRSEQQHKSQVISKIRERETWTHRQMDDACLPVTYIARRTAKEGRGNVVISSEELVNYFTHHYNAGNSVTSLERLVEDNGTLMTLRQIRREAELSSEVARYKTKVLLKERSDSVFVLKKGKSKFIFSSDVVPLFKNWDNRRAVKFANALSVPEYNPGDVIRTYESALSALPKDFKVERDQFDQFFSTYIDFRDSLRGLVSLDSFDIQINRLRVILKYMHRKNYTELYIPDPVSRDTLDGIVGDRKSLPSIDALSTLKQKLEYTVANSNMGLINWFLASRRSLNEDARSMMVRALMKAADKHDPLRAKFSTYAMYYMKNAHYYIRKQSDLTSRPAFDSLDAPVFDDGATSKLDLIADEKVDVRSRAQSGQESEIVNSLLDGLTAKERDVVVQRFGLNGNSVQTLDTIGKTYGLTRERIRQIEQKALRKLRKKPSTILQLKDTLGIS